MNPTETEPLFEPRPFDIHVSTTPRHLKITQGMVEDLITNPCLAAKVILKQDLDIFQQNRLMICWWTPRVMDSSGLVAVLRCLLIPAHETLVAYPVFSTGQNVFWLYFNRVAAVAPIFRANAGRTRVIGIDGQTDEDGKASLKGQSCWTFDFRNGSKIMLPAVGFMQNAKAMASLSVNDLIVDEHTKAEKSGSTGIDDQLIGRARRECFNQDHPVWCNHQIFAATAEDTMHPSHERYKSFLEEVRRGNPDYALIGYSYRDWSDLPFGKTGKSFKAVLRDEKNIRDMKKNKPGAGFRQEGLGIWSKNGRGFYTKDMIDRMQAIGADRGAVPMVSRADDWEKDKDRLSLAHYFTGIDPAKADLKKADDGTMATLRAIQRVEHPTSNLSDWQLDYVWAHLLRGADATQWAAVVHRKHMNFGFTGLCMDPGGGGQWVHPELKKAKQIIRDREVKVRPIGCEEDEALMPASGLFILSMFRRGDAKVKRLWPDLHMNGEDVIIDAMHTEFHQALELGVVGMPPKLPTEALEGYSEERQWAYRLLTHTAAKQFPKVSFRTNDNGSTYYNTHNAREWSARGKKDFAYAMLYAFVAFLQWVKRYDSEYGYQVPEEDADMSYAGA